MEREVPRAELQARSSAKKVETISINHTIKGSGSGSGSYSLTTFSRNHFYLLCILNDLRIGFTLSYNDFDIEDYSGVVTPDEEHCRQMIHYNVDTLKRELEERVITWILGAWTYSGKPINEPKARLADLNLRLFKIDLIGIPSLLLLTFFSIKLKGR
ncbi:hypothetical protein VCRA2119O147_1610014 [Vibrio crassostreae]|uniref:Uncharacterized protein n=2 Tax=Vibrio TaxID=662 RepID=A0A822MWD1_9VIBR|nr:hypothetical protein [Vibrio crassostreae]MDH5953089.1 hypothetical protein [Vibrio crassostreae]TCL15394.1 hypothetical protein EDB52_1372 [Vibrio crassostreae]TCN00551.1 hypothetical protein EDB35_14125 [Vibrio crassostreae]TCT41203.1 hypothetical protein EDB39_14212 [Vibrio crassostreae]TCT45535.1 hypothetical protein EDB42_1322 [Vibrio crassostreae]